MRLDLSSRDHDGYNEYCIRADCRASVIKLVDDGAIEYFLCANGHREERRLAIGGPTMRWWIANDGEYWHESAGVFARNPAGQFLFIERLVHPVGQLTVPAGHVDKGEAHADGANRELFEETGLLASRPLTHIASAPIVGDSCRRGSDAHLWHAYLLVLDSPVELRMSGEGENPQWLTLAEARAVALTYPIRYIIDQHGEGLEAA